VAPGSYFQLLDMGEFAPPAADPSVGVLAPRINARPFVQAASGGSAIASPGFHVGGLVFLPMHESAGIAVPTFLELATYAAYQILASPDRAVRIVSGAFAGEVSMRGGALKVPPTSSGPGKLTLVVGNAKRFEANADVGVRVECRERFSFFRS
jgi:hypothetical protein